MSVSGSDTHADENERLRDHASRLLTENAVLRAERDRERARADRAEAALREIADGTWNRGETERDKTFREFALATLRGFAGRRKYERSGAPAMSAAFEDIRVDRVKAALTDPAARAAFESLMEQLDGAMETAVGAEHAAFLMRGELGCSAAADAENIRLREGLARAVVAIDSAEACIHGPQMSHIYTRNYERWLAARDEFRTGSGATGDWR